MSKLEREWQADEFDAIGILAIDGQFEIEETEGDRVKLEARFSGRSERDLVLEPAGRWLQLQMWERSGDAQFILRLPRQKAWVVDLSAARGEVQVENIQARLRVMLGKGEIRIKDCRGIFNIASGKGEIEMERCVEAEMPERPPMPAPQFQTAHVKEPPSPETPPIPGDPDVGGEFHVRFRRGPGMRYKMKPDVSWDWFGFDSADWAEWGQQFGEQARVWAQQFAGHFLGSVELLPEKAGVGIHSGHGDVELQEIDAKSCAAHLGSGAVKMKEGRIENLDVDVRHGDVECDSVLPAGDWAIEMKNGDIRLALPSNAQARLDVATRHGDIDSQVPLVRVGRPGPESRYGGRMVGTIGPAGENIAQVSLTTLRGDIEIRLKPEKSKFTAPQPGVGAARPAPSAPPAETKAPVNNPPATPSPQPSHVVESTAPPIAEAPSPSSETDKPKVEASGSQPTAGYDSQLAVLQALSAGQITVEEAAKLLRSMEWAADQPKNVWGAVKGLFAKS
jgi:Toastrack DUF4097